MEENLIFQLHGLFHQTFQVSKELGVVLKRCFVNLMPLSLLSLTKNNSFQSYSLLKIFSYSVYVFLLLLIVGCGASKKFTREDRFSDEINKDNSSLIRVLLDEKMNSFNYTVDNTVIIKNEQKTISGADKGNILHFSSDGNNVKLILDDKTYSAKYFQVLPENTRSIKVSNKYYKGAFRIASQNNKIQVINTISLEEYVKGVVPMEMPVGKGTENSEALKA